MSFMNGCFKVFAFSVKLLCVLVITLVILAKLGPVYTFPFILFVIVLFILDRMRSKPPVESSRPRINRFYQRHNR